VLLQMPAFHSRNFGPGFDPDFDRIARRAPMITLRRTVVPVLLALVPNIAFAHPDISHASGLAHGFMHPLSGLDHILAMVLVGMFAWQLGGRALLLVPLAFVTVMAAGGALGMTGVPLPMVEVGIAMSIVVLGVIVATQWRSPVVAAMGIAGVFGIFHGYAHGMEMPADGGGLAYAVGFLSATAIIHMLGLGFGMAVGRVSTERGGSALVRTAGGFAAVAGVGVLAGLI
jgi:urease accessory protein